MTVHQCENTRGSLCGSSSAKLIGLILVIALAVAEQDVTTANGYVVVDGDTAHIGSNAAKFASAIALDLADFFRNQSSTTPPDITISVVGVGQLGNGSKVEFSATSVATTITTALVFEWSLDISLAASTRSPVLPRASAEYSQSAGQPVSLLIREGSCTLLTITVAGDRCGPFSCYGFAMAALLVCLCVGTGVGIYCCCKRCKGTVKAAKVSVDAVPIAESGRDPSPLNLRELHASTGTGGGDAAEDPFAEFEESVPPSAVAASSRRSGLETTNSAVVTVRSSVVPARRGSVGGGNSSNSASSSPPKIKSVRIVEPPSASRKMTDESPRATHVALPRLWNGETTRQHHDTTSAAAASRLVRVPSADAVPQLSMEEERKKLESQEWLRKHLV